MNTDNATIIAEQTAEIARLNAVIENLITDRAYGCYTRQGLEMKYTGCGDVIFLDLDGMHDANAKYGYRIVDEKIAASINAVTRKGESFAGRWYSGDEIVLVVDCGAGMDVAQRLMNAFNSNDLSATMSVVTAQASLVDTMKDATDLVQQSKNNNVRGVIIKGN